MPKNKIKNLWPYLVILAVASFFFWPLLFRQKIFLFGALETHHYPWKVFFSQSLLRGELPLWNPTMGLGYPLLAGGEAGALYLPNLILYKLLPVIWAYNISYPLHFFLAALFMYFFARTLELSESSSLISAITFAFSGFMTAQIINLHIIAAIIYIPLIFALLNLYFKSPKTLHLVGIAAVWALQFYTGAFTISFLTALAAALYIFIPSLWKSIEEKNFNHIRQDFIWGICTALLAVILAMGQILPSYELSNFSYLKQAAGFQLSDILGRERIIYLDVIPLGLALLGLGGQKSRVKSFFIILLVFSLFIALMGLLAGFAFPIMPYQFLALFSYVLALLAGFGLERLMREKLELKKFWPLVFVLLLILLSMAFKISPPSLPKIYNLFLMAAFLLFLLMLLTFCQGLLRPWAFASLTLLLITAELFSFGSFYNPLAANEKAQDLAQKVEIRLLYQNPELKHRAYVAAKVILDEAPPAGYEKETEAASKEKKGEVLNIKYQNQRVDIKVAMNQPGWLVLKDNYYPGWEAYVDRQKTKIYRGNYTMRAVFLEAGEHQVEFIYRPKIFKWGMIMTLLGILVAVKLSWWSVKTQGIGIRGQGNDFKGNF
jgi:hypothetical protein